MTQHTITYDDARREALLDVIRRLNSNPYSLTKSECISEIESMLEAAPQPEADRQDHFRDATKMMPSDDEAAALADQCGVYYDKDPVIAGNHARALLSRYGSSQPTAADGMATLRAALAADPGYAWSWHCAVWAAAHDEGLETGAANRAAARLMRAAFDVDTTKNQNFSSAHLMTKKEQQ